MGAGKGAESVRPLSIDDLCDVYGGETITIEWGNGNVKTYNLKNDEFVSLWEADATDSESLKQDSGFYKLENLQNERMKVILYSGITRVEWDWGFNLDFYVNRDDKTICEIKFGNGFYLNQKNRGYYSNETEGYIRPIVTLKANIKLTQEIDGSWNISE